MRMAKRLGRNADFLERNDVGIGQQVGIRIENVGIITSSGHNIW